MKHVAIIMSILPPSDPYVVEPVGVLTLVLSNRRVSGPGGEESLLAAGSGLEMHSFTSSTVLLQQTYFHTPSLQFTTVSSIST